jgi:hypothetical protein
MLLQGGCACGRVRYEARDPFDETMCHCADCRRSSGAPAIAWFTVSVTNFRVTAGEPASVQSSAAGRRSFCPACGTPLTFRNHTTSDRVDVTTCSLDAPDLVPPKDHTWVRSRVGWAPIGDGLPQYETRRPASGSG